MDIEPKASIPKLLAEALHRVDGRAMHFAVIVLLQGSISFGGRNLILGDLSFASWKVVLGAVLMIPLTTLVYFTFASFSKRDDPISRWINTICLVGIPVYFYFLGPCFRRAA